MENKAESYSPGNTTNTSKIISDILVLPSLMTIESSQDLAATFKQLSLGEKSSLTLDASQVENITTPGLQLIASLQKTLVAQGGELVIKGARETFIHAFKDSGLESLIEASS